VASVAVWYDFRDYCVPKVHEPRNGEARGSYRDELRESVRDCEHSGNWVIPFRVESSPEATFVS